MNDKPATRGILVAGKRIVGNVSLPPGTKDATLPRPAVPAGTIPWHERPREDGLAATDEGSLVRRRFSPRKSWPEVAEIDRRVHELEQRGVTINDELRALQEQHTATVEQDKQSLANWVLDSSSERPLPQAPKLKDRIEQLEAERAAVEVAIRDVLAQKVRLVTKIRSRLVRDARKHRARAIDRLERAITEAEQARADATAYAASEQWARGYPDEATEDLRLQQTKGGRVPQAIPELRTLTVAAQMFAWAREDAAWLAGILSDEDEDDALDPHTSAVWEESDEGRKAIQLASRRVAQSLRPKNTKQAGWEN